MDCGTCGREQGGVAKREIEGLFSVMDRVVVQREGGGSISNDEPGVCNWVGGRRREGAEGRKKASA